LPIAYLISLFIWITSIRTKVIVENGLLRYERLIGGEEVSLKSVKEIVQREEVTFRYKGSKTKTTRTGRSKPTTRRTNDTTLKSIRIGNFRIGESDAMNEEREVKKLIFVIDEAGRTIFKFPANVIRLSERQRFREA